MHNLLRNLFSKPSVYIVCSGLILPAPVMSSGSASNAFGNPDGIVKMDEAWKARKISYDEKHVDADLVVSLGQHTYPAFKKFVDDFAARTGKKIIVQQGTCGVSAKKLSQKKVDIGAFCCPPGKTDRLPGMEFHTIGIAPLALITNTANEVSEISSSDAKNIFSGKSIKWSDVPVENKIHLPSKNIKPVVRLHCKKRPGHWRHLLDNENEFSLGMHEVGVIPDMINEVSKTESAIGYETLFMLEVHKKSGKVKALSIDGHHPSDLQNLLSARYPYYRSFSLTTWSGGHTNNQLSQQLIDSIGKHIEEHGDRYGMLSSAQLRKAGWKFNKDELIGEPDGKDVFSQRD